MRWTGRKTAHHETPVSYAPVERHLRDTVIRQAEAAMNRYGNGRLVEPAIRDMQRQGFRFLFGNNIMPFRMLTRHFLSKVIVDEERIDDIREDRQPLRVRELFNSKSACATFFQPEKRRPGMFLFSDARTRVAPETYWHEFVHYLQWKVGLANWQNMSPAAYFKREIEVNRFILDNRKRLKMSPAAIRNEQRLLRHNLAQYRQHRRS